VFIAVPSVLLEGIAMADSLLLRLYFKHVLLLLGLLSGPLGLLQVNNLTIVWLHGPLVLQCATLYHLPVHVLRAGPLFVPVFYFSTLI
jgi:hypothetical protein